MCAEVRKVYIMHVRLSVGLTKELGLEARSDGTREEGGFPWGLACKWVGPNFTFVASIFRNLWAHVGRELGQRGEMRQAVTHTTLWTKTVIIWLNIQMFLIRPFINK